MWNKFKLQYEAELAAKIPFPIKITLPDGKIVEGQSWRTTPYEVAKGIRYAKHLMFLAFFLYALTPVRFLVIIFSSQNILLMSP